MALLAVVFGLFTSPFANAWASQSGVAMSMDMGDAMQARAEKPPCCPDPCRDMATCVTGCFVVTEMAPCVIAAPLAYVTVGYAAASEHSLTDRSVEPISRPPIP